LLLPDGSGLDVLERAHELVPDVPVIVMTAYGTVETAVQAMKLGAFDYVVKPFDVERIEAVVARALELLATRRENAYLREVADARFEGIIGRSDGIRRVFDAIERVASSPTTALVLGETGVGKELVARAIHARSPRAARLFVGINCAAIPAELLEAELFGVAKGAYTGATADRPGRLETADGGTLFLDEIGDMPLAMQAKLLRVLQEGSVERLGTTRARSVDVRVIAATHRDLPRLVSDGTFRADLYYRLAVFPIDVPPLRERRDDIPLIAAAAVERFAKRAGRSVELSPGAMAVLGAYDWPGNVRELQNVIERAVLLAETEEIDETAMAELLVPVGGVVTGPAASAPMSLAQAVAEAERKAIQAALAATNDNKTRAAALLGVSVRTLWYKLRHLGLGDEGGAPAGR
jgi:two-component system response regulator AtoC